MNIYAMPGHRVRVLDIEGGWERDREFNSKYLEVGAIYEVDHTVVHNSSTDVYLKGPDGITARGESLMIDLGVMKNSVKGIRFNSVIFEDVEEQSDELTQQHPDWIRYHRKR